MTASLLALAAIVVIALLIVQLGANALVLTGLSKPAASFQAASAFFGVGFTTREAEMVVGHPLRRRIILHLIVAGNIGLTSALATLIVTLLNRGNEDGERLLSLLLVLGGVVAFGLLLNVGWIKGPLDAVMKHFLTRSGAIRALDYEVLLNVREGFNVADVELLEGHPFCGKSLAESRPSDRGIVVLGVHRSDGGFRGAPDKDVVLHRGDVIMVYGSEAAVSELCRGNDGP